MLAGVNPLAGLYGYVYGTLTGALFSGSAYMAVQATPMAMVVADVPAMQELRGRCCGVVHLVGARAVGGQNWEWSIPMLHGPGADRSWRTNPRRGAGTPNLFATSASAGTSEPDVRQRSTCDSAAQCWDRRIALAWAGAEP